MATKKPARTNRTTRTKAETEQEFERIDAEESAREPLPAMEAKAREDHEAKVQADTKNVTVDAVKQKLATASISMRAALNNIDEQLQQATDDLTRTREAVALEEKTLEELYGKEIIASTTRSMLDEHKAKVARLEDERSKALADYNDEVAKREIETKEYISKRDTERKREVEEYNYNLAVQRRNEAQKYDDTKRERDRLEKERIETINKGFAERENKIAAAEKELNDLRAKVTAFPQELEAAVKKAEAIVGNTMKRNAEHEMQIVQMQTKSQLDVANNQISSLRTQLDVANAANAKLQEKLAQAEEKVATIATEALKSASGQQTLAQMQSFVQNRDNGAAPRKA